MRSIILARAPEGQAEWVAAVRTIFAQPDAAAVRCRVETLAASLLSLPGGSCAGGALRQKQRGQRGSDSNASTERLTVSLKPTPTSSGTG